MSRNKKEVSNIIYENLEDSHLLGRTLARKCVNSDWGTVGFDITKNDIQINFVDKELRFNCIYFLFVMDKTSRTPETVYVGQAATRNDGTSVLSRLKEHINSTTEAFGNQWSFAAIFTNKNDTWDTAVLDALESIFYDDIPSNLRLNKKKCAYVKDRSIYEDKVDQIKKYLAFMGYSIFSSFAEDTGIQVQDKIVIFDDDNKPIEDLQKKMSRIPEYITPIRTVKAMVDMLFKKLYKCEKDIWTIKFLDPACKGGEFLHEVYERLMTDATMIAKFPDYAERSIHILSNQLFGIAISQVSKDRATKKLFGYGYNIKILDNYINKLKGRNLGTRPSGSYKTMRDILEEVFKNEKGEVMNFDVVLGNPPYNDDDGGGKINNSSSPIYSDFVLNGIQISNRYVMMIIPSRWLSGGKLVLDKFRTNLIESKHIESIWYYNKSTDVFNGIDMAGGVLYFLYDKQNVYDTVNFYRCTKNSKTVEQKNLAKYTYLDAYRKQQYMVLTDEYADSIISKIENAGDDMGIGIQYDPFGFLADFKDSSAPFENCVKVICSNGRETYTYRSNVTNSINKIDKYKVITGKTNPDGGGTNNTSDSWNVLNVPKILNPGEVCTITYFVIGATDTLEEAQNLLSLVKTKIFRYLVMITISGMNLSQRNFRFIPQIKDFSHQWTDELLYKRYNLTQEEINYIESVIKAM